MISSSSVCVIDQLYLTFQAPSISSKSHAEEMEEQENMDASRMMFDWGDQGMGQGFTQEQVDGKSAFSCILV